MADQSIVTVLLSGGMPLVGVAITLYFTNRNQAAARQHERTMRAEAWTREHNATADQRRRTVYEEFLASVDGMQGAVSAMHAARVSGRDPETMPGLAETSLKVTAELYRTRSRLSLYGEPRAIEAGITMSAQVLDIADAYRDFDQWHVTLLTFRERYNEAVRADLLASSALTPGVGTPQPPAA